mmetsp:Transcript_36688/g.105645  ORF Transcript_36688/g.105645 Transcript_36688/m.105645 type:complete len:280 (-) Transcript_36688:190-1029(-)
MFAMCMAQPCCGEVCEVCPNNSGRLSTEEALRAMQGMQVGNGDIVFFHDPGQKQRDEVMIPEPMPSTAMPPSDEEEEEGYEEEPRDEDLSPRTMSNSPMCSPVEQVNAGDTESDASSHCHAGSYSGDPSKAMMHDAVSTACPSLLEAYSSRGDLVSCATGRSSSCGEEQFGKALDRSDGSAKTNRFDRATRVQKLRVFLATSGFRGVNASKKSGSLVSKSFCYPLHAAVRANDLEAIQALLWAGGDRSKTDSQQLTPLALARKLDRNGSHGEAIRLLSA